MLVTKCSIVVVVFFSFISHILRHLSKIGECYATSHLSTFNYLQSSVCGKICLSNITFKVNASSCVLKPTSKVCHTSISNHITIQLLC